MKNITTATIKSIIRKGGATFNRNQERVTLKTGYQVSKCDLLIIPTESLTRDLLKALIKKLASRGEYLGVWIDNGTVYVDISCRVATKRCDADGQRPQPVEHFTMGRYGMPCGKLKRKAKKIKIFLPNS